MAQCNAIGGATIGRHNWNEYPGETESKISTGSILPQSLQK